METTRNELHRRAGSSDAFLGADWRDEGESQRGLSLLPGEELTGHHRTARTFGSIGEADIRASIQRAVSDATREVLKESVWGNCVECGGDLHPDRFTTGCQTCLGRASKNRRTGLNQNGEQLKRKGLWV